MNNESLSTSTAKPAAQGIGVDGIGEPPLTMHEQQPPVTDWFKLASLPPFQMFVAETIRSPMADPESVCRDFIIKQCQTVGEETLFMAYCRWHEAKGYWKSETPEGTLKEVS